MNSWTEGRVPKKGAGETQSSAGKPEAAEERTEQTRSFVRRVRSATRRKYTPEEKIRVVLEGFRREVTVNDLCRREGIKPHSQEGGAATDDR